MSEKLTPIDLDWVLIASYRAPIVMKLLRIHDEQTAELESVYEALGGVAIEKARLEKKLERVRALVAMGTVVTQEHLKEALADE
jgi:hypothetical protein